MPARFVTIDCDTPLLLPVDLRKWMPVGHLAHFILDVVEELDLRQVRVNERGIGSEQYPTQTRLAPLLYRYATGLFSSRRIEQATWDNVPVRLICGDTHPDHDTICTFRRENKALLQETFVQVLGPAQALKFSPVAQIPVAVDGTKVLANASKHAAVSRAHAGKTIARLEFEVKELLAKAEQATARRWKRDDPSARSARTARTQSPTGGRPGRDRSAGQSPGGGGNGRIPSQAGQTGGLKGTGRKAARSGTQCAEPAA
jgi:transposase